MKLLPLSLTALLLAGTAAAALSFDQDSETPVQEEAPAERQDAKQDEKAPEDAPEEAPAEEAAEEEAEPERVDRVRPPVVRVAPKRIGGDLLDGIRVTPKPATPVTQPVAQPVVGPPVAGPVQDAGQQTDPHAGHDHGSTGGVANADQAPPGRGGVSFEPGSQLKRFGDLVQGESRDTVFTAKSSGDEPLVISSVTKSCGCTRADILLVEEDGARTPYVLNSPIPVGQEFEIHAEIDTTGKQNRFRTDITLMTNDPRKGIVFSLEVDVKAPLVANPRSLNLAQLKATETKQGQVLITTELDRPFALRIDENIPLKNCEVELVPSAPDAEGKSTRWVVKVKVGPNLDEGTYYQSLRLLSDIPNAGKELTDGTPMPHELIVFVTAQVQGPVTVSPAHMSFGILRPDQPAERKATIRITDGDWELTEAPKVEFKGYGADFPYADDFSATLVPIEGTKDWELTVQLAGLEMDGSGAFRGLAVVHLGHPAKDKLEIGFSGAVRTGVTRTPGQAPR